jgi:LmbE family N-acetylglucosaminyl deacetylase
MGASLTFSGKRVCFIGAHPDDIELGAGALIAQIADQTDIRCVTLSDNQKNPDLHHLVEEHYASMAALGVPKEKVILGQFETRLFPHYRQEILEYMIQLNQDHGTITEEALRAFRGTTVLGFDVIRSSYGFFPNFLIEVSESDVEKKINALNQYTTYASRYYFNAELTRATLVRYGAIAERPYAEGFDILRVIGKFGCI